MTAFPFSAVFVSSAGSHPDEGAGPNTLLVYVGCWQISNWSSKSRPGVGVQAVVDARQSPAVLGLSDESGRNEVYIQAFPQPRGAHRLSTRGGTRPQWGPAGDELFYQSLDSKVMAISLWSALTVRQRRLPGARRGIPDQSPGSLPAFP
jgi:hypothetical protein